MTKATRAPASATSGAAITDETHGELVTAVDDAVSAALQLRRDVPLDQGVGTDQVGGVTDAADDLPDAADRVFGARPDAIAPTPPVMTPPINENAPGRRAARTDSATEAPTMPTPKAAATRPYSVDVPCSGPLTRKTRATSSTPRTSRTECPEGQPPAPLRRRARTAARHLTADRASAARGSATGGSGPIRMRSSAEIANEAALTPNAKERPDSPASTPPTAGPRTICRLKPRESSALACGRDCSGTSRLTAPLPAGGAERLQQRGQDHQRQQDRSGGRVMARAA